MKNLYPISNYLLGAAIAAGLTTGCAKTAQSSAEAGRGTGKTSASIQNGPNSGAPAPAPRFAKTGAVLFNAFGQDVLIQTQVDGRPLAMTKRVYELIERAGYQLPQDSKKDGIEKLWRWNTDGTPDASLGKSGVIELQSLNEFPFHQTLVPYSLLVTPEDKILIGGEIKEPGSSETKEPLFMQLSLDGKIDPDFRSFDRGWAGACPLIKSPIWGMAIKNSGGIIGFGKKTIFYLTKDGQTDLRSPWENAIQQREKIKSGEDSNHFDYELTVMAKTVAAGAQGGFILDHSESSALVISSQGLTAISLDPKGTSQDYGIGRFYPTDAYFGNLPAQEGRRTWPEDTYPLQGSRNSNSPWDSSITRIADGRYLVRFNLVSTGFSLKMLDSKFYPDPTFGNDQLCPPQNGFGGPKLGPCTVSAINQGHFSAINEGYRARIQAHDVGILNDGRIVVSGLEVSTEGSRFHISLLTKNGTLARVYNDTDFPWMNELKADEVPVALHSATSSDGTLFISGYIGLRSELNRGYDIANTYGDLPTPKFQRDGSQVFFVMKFDPNRTVGSPPPAQPTRKLPMDLPWSGTAVSIPAPPEGDLWQCSQIKDIRKVPAGFRCKTSNGKVFKRVQIEPSWGEAWKDESTGLVWSTHFGRFAYPEAQQKCLDVGGRVPSMKEFATAALNYYDEVLPYVCEGVVGNSVNGKDRTYWTSDAGQDTTPSNPPYWRFRHHWAREPGECSSLLKNNRTLDNMSNSEIYDSDVGSIDLRLHHLRCVK